MHVLIVEPDPDLGSLWRRHIERMGPSVTLARGQAEAVAALRRTEMQVIVLDLQVAEGSAFAIADYASYARPEAKVIFVTSTSFFSDGSIFRHIPNACAYVGASTPPDDLAAMVAHWGGER